MEFVPNQEQEIVSDSEIVFQEQVLGGVEKLAERHDGSIAVLFDVDDTLLFGPKNNMYLRSGFTSTVTVLQAIYGDHVRFGLLTMWSELEMQEAAQNRSALSPVLDYLAKECILTAAVEDGRIRIQDLAGLQANAPAGIMSDGMYAVWLGGEMKKHVLRGFLEKHQDVGAVVIEDMPWVHDISGQPRTEGVYIRP